jgi:diguanylate cyclase (GGDEF)-like protein
MVVGVLHAAISDVDPDTEHALDALLSTAAAALESARLHSLAETNASIDALTQLPNRRRMEADLEREWDRSRRHGRPLSFIMVDLDHFKRLNDEHGHPVGDTVLRAAAAAARGSLRETGTAYRYGGEELAIVLRDTSLGDATAIAERVRAAIAAVTVRRTAARVTASLGLAERTSDMRFHVELVAAADAALYTAKQMGRNRVVTHVVLTAASDDDGGVTFPDDVEARQDHIG